MRIHFLAALVVLNAACVVPASESEEGLGKTSAALSEAGTIRGVGGQCLDVQWANPAAGTPVWMWPCNGGVAQQWRMTADNEIRITGLGDKCLTVGPYNGSKAYIGYCTGANTQKWVLLQDGSIRPMFDGTFCLDVAYAGTSPGTSVGITYCNPSLPSWPAQTWNFASWADRLHAGQVLRTHQQIRSQNGVYRLIMQGDCNLVLYQGVTPIWASNTMGRGSGCYASMQTDGNFVVYDYTGRAVWATNTVGYGDYIVMQDDNNLVVYDVLSYRSPWPTWSSRSGRLDNPPPPPGGPTPYEPPGSSCGWVVNDCTCEIPSQSKVCRYVNTCTGESEVRYLGPC